jgi:hypothetical protein
MSKLHDPVAVARATGATTADVKAVLEPLFAALEARGVLTTMTAVAALATIAVECSFRPVSEAWWLSERRRHDYLSNYDGRKDLGNVKPGDGARFCGRGFIQLTGRNNYTTYGSALGIDLVSDPESALRPEIAVKILAVYFKWHKVAAAADERDWQRVRKLVNGGLNGYPRFKACVAKLLLLTGD